MTALNHTVDLDAAIAFLMTCQHSSGGWGYRPGASPCVEPTSAVVLALDAVPGARTNLEKGTGWLKSLQHPDGGWGMSAEDDESGWHTAWAILALARKAGAESLLIRARNWLVAAPVIRSTSDEMQSEIRKTLAIDFSLSGFPWLPQQASWVEPTALGLLALSRAPSTGESAVRISEAMRYLVDRRCVAGGWNFGNPVMLGAQLPPRAHMTAVSLLALALLAPDQVERRDLDALRRQMNSESGSDALAWGLLALKSLNEPAEDHLARLAELQSEDGSWDQNPYHTAMAFLADGGRLWPDT